MSIEGQEALELYVSGIGSNMAALKAAVGSLEKAVAERGKLIDQGDLELVRKYKQQLTGTD